MDLTDHNNRAKIMNWAIEYDVKLIVFDNISCLLPNIDEKEKKDYDPFNQYLLDLRSIGISSIVVHHTNKQNLSSGHKGKENNTESIWYMYFPKNYNKSRDNLKIDLDFKKARLACDDDDLLKRRELQYQKNLRGEYKWSYDKASMFDNPEFLKALAEGKTVRELGALFNRSISTISKWTQMAIKKGLIEIRGNHKNRQVKITESGTIITGDEIIKEIELQHLIDRANEQ